MSGQKQSKGFTIIEVVLVLAIAALIFLMIFVALPALQRNQANGARKADVGVVVSALGTYRTNNSGRLPTTAMQLGTYLDGGLARLDSTPANVSYAATPSGSNETVITGTGSSTDIDKLYVRTGAKCTTSSSGVVQPAGARQAAVLTVVEVNASALAVVCQNA